MQRSPDGAEPAAVTPAPSVETGSEKPAESKTPTQRKFHNGWTKQLENLVAEWADKSSCYQWMHQKTEEKFSKLNMYYTIPVIILSTLTGTANFATDAIVSSVDMKKYITFGIGAVSIITGIISTVANFLRYAQGSEAHRVAGISWGKFQRFISIELSLHPNERMDAMSFLKMGRIELDRLIEQSPPIPPKSVELFMEAFKDKPDIKRPEIAGGIEHTRIFEDTNGRLAKIASEAAYIIQQKKGLMRQLVMDDIDKQIVKRAREERQEMEEKLRQEIITSAREAALATLKSAPLTNYVNSTFKNAREEMSRTVPLGIVEKTREKLTNPSVKNELEHLAGEGTVSAMKEKLHMSTVSGKLNTIDGGHLVSSASGHKLMSVASGIATMAAAAAAARFNSSSTTPATQPTQPSPTDGPTSVRLEIVEERSDDSDFETESVEKI